MIRNAKKSFAIIEKFQKYECLIIYKFAGCTPGNLKGRGCTRTARWTLSPARDEDLAESTKTKTFDKDVRQRHSTKAFDKCIRQMHSSKTFDKDIRQMHSTKTFDKGIRQRHSAKTFDKVIRQRRASETWVISISYFFSGGGETIQEVSISTSVHCIHQDVLSIAELGT